MSKGAHPDAQARSISGAELLELATEFAADRASSFDDYDDAAGEYAR